MELSMKSINYRVIDYILVAYVFLSELILGFQYQSQIKNKKKI